MQKVYLLLRDNKQSGPYTLDELLQLGLRPFDLIWVEGRSSGWSYPSEINALKPYVPEAQAPVQFQSTESMPSTPPTYNPADTTTSSSPKVTTPPKSVLVILPGKGTQPPPPKEITPTSDWDRRVEEVRQRAQAFTPQKEEDIAALNTHYARSLDEVEEQYTGWVYQQKTKKKPVLTGRQLSSVAIIIILVGGGYLAATSLLDGNNKDKGTSLIVQPDQRKETPHTETEPEEPAVVYEEEAQPQEYRTTTTPVTKEVKKAAGPVAKAPVVRKPVQQPAAQVPDPADQQLPPGNTATAEPEPVEEEAVAAAPKERKKSLAEKIDGFIEKLASKGRSGAQKEVEEETPGTGPVPGSGERRSTRRGEEGTSSIDPAALARQVEVVANNTDNWMMGVKDLKLTVRNHSAVTIKSAAIEVSYYSENDNLLEKKTVYVSNIAAKGRKIVAAPDQRMADHVEFRVFSVSADEEAYAQQ